MYFLSSTDQAKHLIIFLVIQDPEAKECRFLTTKGTVTMGTD
jgi:hypothetical protein